MGQINVMAIIIAAFIGTIIGNLIGKALWKLHQWIGDADEKD